MTMEETGELKIFERMILWKIQGPIKEGEAWRIRAKRERKVRLQMEDTVKFIQPLLLRWYGHVERIQYQRMVK